MATPSTFRKQHKHKHTSCFASTSQMEVVTPKPTGTIKFLCSYGGKILPRHPDGKLRYYGGETRVLAIDRSIPFSELLMKLGELCGTPVTLRCQLPTEDLDALVSITSDEDLANLIEEYDRTPSVQSSNLKIRAFLSLPKKPSPATSPLTFLASHNCTQQMLKLKLPGKVQVRYDKSGGNLLRYACENSSQRYLVHSGGYRQ
ncbi:RAF-like serine/threonine-protein kinase PRAF [Bidens hawaiensis]|uniref:RAF-like serine/threonine-protein kinase PRAF n=1 Tax=Bidens hawaiensis TaxID=980011 RepID=UPI0040490509